MADMSDDTGLETIAEVQVDNRRRISLSAAGVAENSRFMVQQYPDGTIILTPMVSVPLRELELLSSPEFMEMYGSALREARTEAVD